MNILPQLNQKNIIKDLIHLLYPSACLVCESELIQTEQFVCSLCDSALVKTFFHLYQEATEADKLFWGRVQLKVTYAHFYLRKNSAIQTLLFNLKYKNNPQIGWYFGEEIGRCLIKIDALNNAEALIPVPLHYKKRISPRLQPKHVTCKRSKRRHRSSNKKETRKTDKKYRYANQKNTLSALG
jgi:predicted amidophosphoribosyltransferase